MKAKNVKYPIYDYGQLSVSISKGNGKLKKRLKGKDGLWYTR